MLYLGSSIMTDKKYGLILSGKSALKPPKFQASHNIFGNDSDSEDESNKKPVLLKPSDNINRQTKITQEKAIIEDPTVYQYDEIYDEMVGAKEQEKIKIKEEKKPRYIENLMKTANKRKIDNERRLERQIQKEREKEGDEFKDKEVFVTSAYKKKLEEMRQEEEKEQREDYLERIGDVTKQQDLGGFYRHLYEQKLGAETKDKVTVPSQKTKNSDNKAMDSKDKEKEIAKKRNYRKRKSSDSKKDLSDGEIEESDEEINRLNLEDIKMSKKSKTNAENIDADSDFSIDESSDEDSKTDDKPTEILQEITKVIKPLSPVKNEESNKIDIEVVKVEKSEVKEIKPKIDIWKKRTVGEAFEQALKRYYERKASRGY